MGGTSSPPLVDISLFCVPQSVKCDICGETFVNKSFLEDHTTVHITTCDSLQIPQYDGNFSLDESILSESDLAFSSSYPKDLGGSSIPVIISSRSSLPKTEESRLCFNKRIIRSNKCIEALNFPIFTVYNMRSLWSKINCLAEDDQ